MREEVSMIMKIDFSFGREERLKSFSLIRDLFGSGRVLNHYPMRIIWLPVATSDNTFPVQLAISVPRKKFPKAVHRNRIKRQIKEAYRLNKHRLYRALEGRETNFAVMIIYVDKKMPVFDELEPQVRKALDRLGKKMLAPENK